MNDVAYPKREAITDEELIARLKGLAKDIAIEPDGPFGPKATTAHVAALRLEQLTLPLPLLTDQGADRAPIHIAGMFALHGSERDRLARLIYEYGDRRVAQVTQTRRLTAPANTLADVNRDLKHELAVANGEVMRLSGKLKALRDLLVGEDHVCVPKSALR
jgi:hypothetical protein